MPKLHFERRGAVAFVEVDDQIVSIHLESAGVAVVVDGNVADIVAGNSQVNGDCLAASKC